MLTIQFMALISGAVLLLGVGWWLCRRPVRAGWVLVLLSAVCGTWAWGEYALYAGEGRFVETTPETPDDEEPLKLPEGWPEGHPVPIVKTNCVRCHLGAGRELTLAVAHFAHSIHDLNYISCADCHGGNTEDDAKAHDDAFGFIGTKLSAHLAKCGECHAGEAEVLASGPHHWEWSKRINLDYPMCVDCHGNHDVGNPPSDFQLKQLCTDCHEDETNELFPHLTSIIDQNDRLWRTLVKVHEKQGNDEERVPAEFQEQVDSLRARTMQYVHESQELSAEDAQALNDEVGRLREALEKWLATDS